MRGGSFDGLHADEAKVFDLQACLDLTDDGVIDGALVS
jgi:hypothetical protein